MVSGAETVKIGGVVFEKNEVANHTTTTKNKTNIKGLWEQYKEYTVTLKDGTKVKYQEQAENRQATIDITDDGSVNFFGLERAKITGTKNNDYYRLHGCKSSIVNVKGDSENSAIARLFGAEWKADKVKCYNRELPNGDKQPNTNNSARVDGADTTSGLRKLK